MDWKNEFKIAVDEQPVNEDGGLLAGGILAAGVAGAYAASGISGMKGRYVNNTWKGQAGPISRSDNEFNKNYPTGYSAGALIKHAIIGKSGNDKELEGNNARRRHHEGLHRGEAKAIEVNNGHDPLGAVRHGVTVPETHQHHVAYVSAVLDHAKETGNTEAAPAHDEEDFRDRYDVEHAAAEHLAREGAVPRWGDHKEAGDYYLDRVYKHRDTGKMMASYRENQSPYGFDHQGNRIRNMPLIKHVEIN